MHSAMTLSRITAFTLPCFTLSKKSFALACKAGLSATRYRTMVLVSGRLPAGFFTDRHLPRFVFHLPHGYAWFDVSGVFAERAGCVPHRFYHNGIVLYLEIDGIGFELLPNFLRNRHLPLPRNFDCCGCHLLSPYLSKWYYL